MDSMPNRLRATLATIALAAPLAALLLPAEALAGGPEGNNSNLFPTQCSTAPAQSCTTDGDCPSGGKCKLVTSGPSLKGFVTVIADNFPSDNNSTADRPVVTVVFEVRAAGQRRFFSKVFQTSSGTGWPEIGEWFAFDENEFDLPPDPNSEDDVHDLTAERSNVPNWKFIRPCFGLKPVGDAILEVAQSVYPGHDFSGETPVITKLKKRQSDASAQDTFTADLARVGRYKTKISFVTLTTSDPFCTEG